MSQIISNIKDDFQVVLVLSCFVGHPVCSLQSCADDTSIKQFLNHVYLNLLKVEYIAYANLINWSEIVTNEYIKLF